MRPILLPDWAEPPGGEGWTPIAATNDAVVWQHANKTITYQRLNEMPPLQEHPFRAPEPEPTPRNLIPLWSFIGAACGSMVVEIVVRIHL